MCTCMHTCAHVYRGLRSRSAVFSCSSPPCLGLDRKLWGSSFLCLPNATDLHHEAQLFFQCWGSNSGPCALVANAQTTESPPQPSFEYFDCTKCWVSFQHCCTHIDNMLQSCQHTHLHTLLSLVSQSLLLPPFFFSVFTIYTHERLVT